jgi:signal transduction histidine kinase
MTTRSQIHWLDWGFVLFLGLACAILSALQYRWTGELAQAELAHLRENLEDQSKLLCRDFDAELSTSCRQMLVTRTEMEEQGRDAACLQGLREWEAGNPRPIFSRIALAVLTGEDLQLFAIEPGATTLKPIEWPAHWKMLKEHNDSCRLAGKGWTRFSDPNGTLIDFYLASGSFSRTATRPSPAWMIFELDAAYLKHIWLPELIQTYLNPRGLQAYDIDVRTTAEPHSTVFATNAAAQHDPEKAVVTRFNRQARSFYDARTFPGESRWTMQVWDRPGVLEGAVAGSRKRNLAVALVLNGLIFASGLALVRHVRQSRQLAEAQMNFVAGVSHELRTPLTVIRGAAHNLQRGVVTDPARVAQYAELIGANAEQLREIVEDVLAIAAARRDKEPEREPVAVGDVLTQAIEDCEPDTRAAGCEVESKVPADLPPVQGDPAVLRRVFQNLISNAARHAASGRWIGISATAVNGTEPAAVVVKVADRGPGIPKAEQDAVFEPFIRGTAAREAQLRGSGLGLSLVREMVQAHGGTVALDSEPGCGAVFTVKLPSA